MKGQDLKAILPYWEEGELPSMKLVQTPHSVRTLAFLMVCVFIFLLVTLFLDGFKYFIGADYREGLDVVPILLMANLFLGVYVNLSVWYKLTDRTGMGAWVSLIAAAITIGLNFWWIPLIGYRGAAWAHLACYGGMAVASWLLGRRYYPVPYPVLHIAFYLLFGVGLYLIDREVVLYCGWNPWTTGAALMGCFLLVTALADVGPLLKGRRAVV